MFYKKVPMSALILSHVSKWLDSKQILHDISLEIKKGEVFWFLGPNGAGKTTTMKCILGLIVPEEWTVEILNHTTLTEEVKKKIGFMPENTYLYKYLTWREFLRFNGKFYNIPEKDLTAKVEELLIRVWLDHAGDKRLSRYSKWMLQRIGLAQAIIHSPDIVFLDEPMSGLDPIGRKMVKDLIIELWNKWTTVFFNTHILSDVEAICDSFAIIHKGKLVANDTIASLTEPLEDFFMKSIESNTSSSESFRIE